MGCYFFGGVLTLIYPAHGHCGGSGKVPCMFYRSRGHVARGVFASAVVQDVFLPCNPLADGGKYLFDVTRDQVPE